VNPASLESRIADAVTGAPGVTAVYLFGSVAEDRPHRDSDVDVGVLLDWERFPTRDARFEARLAIMAAIARAVGRNDVDLVILNDVPAPFARAIVARGRRLFVADADVEHAFRRDTMLRAADLDPFLRRMRRLTLETLTR
jgi:predicted nucleotidyltransferase